MRIHINRILYRYKKKIITNHQDFILFKKVTLKYFFNVKMKVVQSNTERKITHKGEYDIKERNKTELKPSCWK